MNLKTIYKIGDGATVCSHSDQHACTVVAVTAKTVTLRQDKATLLNRIGSNAPDALVFTQGGFCGHVEGEQRYKYEPDPNGLNFIGRLRRKPLSVHEKVGDEWQTVEKPNVMTVCGKRIVPGRSEYYDFNF